MNIYKISIDGSVCLDCYDSAIVVAYNEQQARYVHPSEGIEWNGGAWYSTYNDKVLLHLLHEWAKPIDVSVKLIGVADKKYMKPQVILASYNES